LDADDKTERIKRDVARAIEAMSEEGVAGGTIGPNGLRLGMPTWDERTRHQRFGERAKTHGYPLGFAKSQLAVRRQLLESMRARIQALNEEDRVAAERAREAVAWALDAERFLGSFNHAGSDGLPIENVDRVADQILAWLDSIGFRVVPKDAADRGAPPAVDRPQGQEGMMSDRVETPDAVINEPDGAPAEPPDDEPRAAIKCQACEGTGYVGGGMFEEPCPLCRGAGEFALEHAGRYDPHDPLLGGEPNEASVKSLMLNTGLGASELGISLAGLDLRESVWSGYGFDLSSADFSGSDLSGADFMEVALVGADLSGAKLVGACLANADLTGANLHGADLADADLAGAQLLETNLGATNLVRRDLSNVDLRAAQLQDANLGMANLTEANLRSADLSRADLSGAQLTRANFIKATLKDARLNGCDLTGADLAGADLTGARLTGVDLETAGSLHGAVLHNVEGLSTAQLERCLERGAVPSKKDRGD
jgi:uncharacterized protein YjbI with pentapeptide repeats